MLVQLNQVALLAARRKTFAEQNIEKILWLVGGLAVFFALIAIAFYLSERSSEKAQRTLK